MSLIDYPDKWIIKMFKFNERENGGNSAAHYQEGINLDQVDLESDEWIFGHISLNETTYYFTSTSLIIKNEKQEKIKISDIIRTNGSYRSGHKIIDVETNGGKVYRIKIIEFPNRIQQLFYQLIEKHGSLIRKSLYEGPVKLRQITSDLSQDEMRRFGFTPDSKITVKRVEIEKNGYRLEYHGIIENEFIKPDHQGIIILKVKNDIHEVEIFDSTSDGYVGMANKITGFEKTFTKYKGELTGLILKFKYSIEDYEYDDLMEEFNLKSKSEINNFFGFVEIYGERDGEIILLTEFET